MLAVGAVAAALAVGCGGSDEEQPAPSVSGDQRGVLGAIDDLQAASRRGDAQRICGELFTNSLASSIESASKRSCPAEIKATLAQPDAQFSVGRDIRITGGRATATVRERSGTTSKLYLVKDGERWRIERIEPTKRS